MNSFAGQILWIDLSTGIIEKKAIDPALIKNWLGGRGINAKLLWDLTKPGIDPLGPDNPIIFGTGVFSGTFAPSSGRLSITCKSPATNLYLKTNVGSHFAAELKFARAWGASEYDAQQVGANHIVEDGDVLEFHM